MSAIKGVSGGGPIKLKTNPNRPGIEELGSTYPRRRRAYFLLLLLVTAILIAYADKELLAVLVTPIKSELRLSDTQVSLLQGVAVNLFLGLAALPFGRLVDSKNRMRLIAVSVAIWSVFTALTALCSNFLSLFVCRIAIGIAEASLTPATYSIIADLFPIRKRPAVNAVFFGATLLVASIAFVGSAALVQVIDGHGIQFEGLTTWRITFLAAAAPGFLVALWFFSVREPVRQFEAAAWGGSSKAFSFAGFVYKNWIPIGCFFGALAGISGALESVLLWMPSILSRAYGLSISKSGELFGAVFGGGSILGVAVAVIVSQFYEKRERGFSPVALLGIGTIGTAVCCSSIVAASTALGTLAVIFAFFVFSYLALAIGPTIIMNVTPNGLRGRMFALFVVLGVIAQALLPTAVGVLSDQTFSGSRGLLFALAAVIIPCTWISPLLLGMGRTSLSRLANDGGSTPLEDDINASIEANQQ